MAFRTSEYLQRNGKFVFHLMMLLEYLLTINLKNKMGIGLQLTIVVNFLIGTMDTLKFVFSYKK